ncbi:MAG: FeoA domain protein [Firmicutes bacterium]|nr:FeoA domain protein [Bacillota bacterium]
MNKSLSLIELKRGEKAIISALPTKAVNLRKLLVFGLLPGVEINVLQVSPSYVVAVGNTYLALDREIARGILVMDKKWARKIK